MLKNLKRNLAYWTEEWVEPVVGSVLFCKLAGNAEHTGIFIGYNGEYDRCIVELGGDGNIRLVTPGEFLSGPSGVRVSGIAIYTSCCEDGLPIGRSKNAELAKKMVGESRNYNLVLDNCHQFTCGCLSEDFENSNNFFWMMEEEVKKYLNFGKNITWRSWDFENYVSQALGEKDRDLAALSADDRHYKTLEDIENSNLSYDEKRKLTHEEYKRRNKELKQSIEETKKLF